MNEQKKPITGKIVWTDLTVPNATEVKDFYQSVVGWQAQAVPMGDYEDFSMSASDGKTVSGICHTKGANAGIPAQWLIYLTEDNLDSSLEEVKRLGGCLVAGPKANGDGRYAIIKDPAGAVCALYQG